jgi:hypothetical protein
MTATSRELVVAITFAGESNINKKFWEEYDTSSAYIYKVRPAAVINY